MGLREKRELRDGIHVFRDRQEAGQMLASMLDEHRNSDALVMAIPSGGVPVGVEIARELHIPMDVIIVRKIQLPDNPEAGFGAMSPDGTVILNERLMEHLNLSLQEIDRQIERTRNNIMKREKLFRREKMYPVLRGKSVIIADDGLASGYTMLAALDFIRKKGPSNIIVAVPTACSRTADMIVQEVDELICPNIRSGWTFAVADAYENWYDVDEEEVVSILEGESGTCS